MYLTPIRTLWGDLRTQFQADFKVNLYVATACYVALLICVNYAIDLEDSYIDGDLTNPWRPLMYAGLYMTSYYGAVWIWTRFHRRPDVWHNPKFWTYSLTGLLIYSYYAGFYGYAVWSERLFDGQLYVFSYKCLSNLHSVVTVAVPLYLFYRLVDRQPSGFYGMVPKRKGLSIYGLLLALMVPLIAIASFQPDFLESYPTYRGTDADEFFGVPEWVPALVYELCYGWDFIPTELVFRGFLVIGMSRFLGQGAILPMVVCYASIHFGKPLGETISSLFGGYLLGVLALYTRSIWGGLLIHIGIAWGMEIAAFVQTAL